MKDCAPATVSYHGSMAVRHKLSTFVGEISRNRIAYMMAFPGFLYLLLFAYLPFVYVVSAFQDFNLVDGILGSPWVGFENFEFFFGAGGNAWNLTANTLLLNTLFIFCGMALQVTVALLVNEIRSRGFKKITQTFYFFPFFLSWVVIGEIVYSLLSSEYGAINNVLVTLGLEPVRWYRNPQYWRGILVFTRLWRGTGYGTLVYLAAIAGFDRGYYEAALIDGANRFQCMTRITLPMLRPTIVVLVLFALGRMFFGDFGMIYGIVRDVGPLLSKVEIIDTYVYRAFRATGSISMNVAIGLYQSVFGLITIVVFNRVGKRVNEGSALF